MRKKIAAAVGLSAVLLLLLPTLLTLTASPAQTLPEKSAPRSARTENGEVFSNLQPEASPVQDELYILKEINGQIGVFGADNADSPLFITETRTKSLRLGDRALIRQGISVFGYENLLRLLEDFGS